MSSISSNIDKSTTGSKVVAWIAAGLVALIIMYVLLAVIIIASLMNQTSTFVIILQFATMILLAVYTGRAVYDALA